LVLIAVNAPLVYRGLYVGYVAVLFATPYFAASVAIALSYIFAVRRDRALPPGALPAYPEPSKRENLFLILGEQHHATRPEPSPEPRWLTIPARGLFTGVAVIGAVGAGKTSGCLYPYAEQLLGFRPQDRERRIGGLVLEVKGDFCHDVRRMLAALRRESD
jgi:hypothetical protein